MPSKVSLLLGSYCALVLSAAGGEVGRLPDSAVVTEPPSDRGFIVTLPAWGAGLSGEVGVAGYDPVSVDVGFEDILKNLDMAAALTLEARHRGWGLILDGMYLKMSASGETPGRLLKTVDVQVEQVLAEIAVAYRLLEGDRGYLDILAGARYLHLSSEVSFQLDSAGVREVSDDLSSAILDRTTDAIRREVDKAAAKAAARLATLEVDDRAEALRDELQTRAVEKILEEQALRDIIKAVRNLTPAQREKIQSAVQSSRELIAANKALAQAVVQERVGAAVAGARKKAQQAVANAKKQLSRAIDSAIRKAVPQEVSGSKSWVDPFIGFRGRYDLTDKLYLATRGDVGGFGVGSELAWNVNAALGYQWNKRFSTELGYRCLSVDYSDDGFVYDTETSGLFLGMAFKL